MPRCSSSIYFCSIYFSPMSFGTSTECCCGRPGIGAWDSWGEETWCWSYHSLNRRSSENCSYTDSQMTLVPWNEKRGAGNGDDWITLQKVVLEKSRAEKKTAEKNIRVIIETPGEFAQSFWIIHPRARKKARIERLQNQREQINECQWEKSECWVL